MFISLDYNAGTGYEGACTADPEGVLVQNEDMAVSFALLSNRLAQSMQEKKDK